MTSVSDACRSATGRRWDRNFGIPLPAGGRKLLAEEFAGAAFAYCFDAFAVVFGFEEPGLFLEFVIGLRLDGVGEALAHRRARR